MSRSRPADVWVLLGPHKGDNNQVLALAENLSLPFRTITLRYRWFAHFPALLRLVTHFGLTPEARLQIAPPWPSLVLGIGQRSAPIARYIRRQSGGCATIVRLGDPMAAPSLFDLVITTTQYAVPDADNVVRLPITITNDPVAPEAAEERWLQAFARPRRIVVVGGKTSLWRLDRKLLGKALRALSRTAAMDGGSVIAVSSPRTSTTLIAEARAVLGSDAVVVEGFPRYGALLVAADEVYVTADSVSMLSDAVASGKPVGMIALEPDWIGKWIRLFESLIGRPLPLRDLARFWDDLHERGLIGPVDSPRRGSLEIAPLETAIVAIHSAMGDRRRSSPSIRPSAPAAAVQSVAG